MPQPAAKLLEPILSYRITTPEEFGGKLMAAIKTTKWVSPRGPMAIDPETRDVMENIYIRRVEKVGGKLVNVDFAKVENVKDPVHEAMKKKK